MLLLAVVLVARLMGVYAVLPTYCNVPLDASDCGARARHVYTYYKPGSRCELAEWRGCDTGNKFATEGACMDTCVFRRGHRGLPADGAHSKPITEVFYVEYLDQPGIEIPQKGLKGKAANIPNTESVPQNKKANDNTKAEMVQNYKKKGTRSGEVDELHMRNAVNDVFS